MDAGLVSEMTLPGRKHLRTLLLNVFLADGVKAADMCGHARVARMCISRVGRRHSSYADPYAARDELHTHISFPHGPPIRNLQSRMCRYLSLSSAPCARPDEFRRDMKACTYRRPHARSRPPI